MTGAGLLILAFAQPPARAAEWSLSPGISVTEEYNDNVFETAQDRKPYLITHVQPSLTADYTAPLWSGRMFYDPVYRIFAGGKLTNELKNDLSAKVRVVLVENFAYLEASERFQDTTLDGDRELTYLDRVGSNLVMITPYAVQSVNPRWNAREGYRFLQRNYFLSGTIDNVEHALYGSLSREMTPLLSLFLNLDAARVFPVGAASHQRLINSCGGRYEYADGSSIRLEGGYSVFSPESSSPSWSPYWQAAISQRMASRTTASQPWSLRKLDASSPGCQRNLKPGRRRSALGTTKPSTNWGGFPVHAGLTWEVALACSFRSTLSCIPRF